MNYLVFLSVAGMKICSLRQESCEVRYFLNTKIQGNESNIKVFLDYNQPSLVTLREGSSNCNRGIELWPIFLGIILGTIVVGMLVFMVWRCCTYFGVSTLHLPMLVYIPPSLLTCALNTCPCSFIFSYHNLSSTKTPCPHGYALLLHAHHLSSCRHMWAGTASVMQLPPS